MLSAKRWSCYPKNGVLDACVKHMFFSEYWSFGCAIWRTPCQFAKGKGQGHSLGGQQGWHPLLQAWTRGFLNPFSFSRTSPFPALIFEVEERHFVKASRGPAWKRIESLWLGNFFLYFFFLTYIGCLSIWYRWVTSALSSKRENSNHGI